MFGKTTYTAAEVITNVITNEVKVDPVDALVVDAIAASSTETNAKAQADYDASVLQTNNEIELRVRKEQQVLDDAIIIELEKEVGSY